MVRLEKGDTVVVIDKDAKNLVEAEGFPPLVKAAKKHVEWTLKTAYMGPSEGEPEMILANALREQYDFKIVKFVPPKYPEGVVF